MDKTTRQKLAVKTFNKFIKTSECKGGTLCFPQGFGKTRTAITIIKSYIKIDSTLTFAVIVPRDRLRTQWKEVLDSFDLSSYVKVYTSSELKAELLVRTVDVLILDEIHKLLTDLDMKVYSKFKRKCLLGLTATPPNSGERRDKMDKIAPICDRISLKEALENNWISYFTEFNLAIDKENLTAFEKKAYLKYNKLVQDNWMLLGETPEEAITVAQKCLRSFSERSALSMKMLSKVDTSVSENVIKFSPSRIQGYAKNYLDGIRGRKSILDNALIKKEMAIELCNYFIANKKKTILFNQSTDFADDVARHCKGESYHSSKKTIIRNGKKFGKTRLNNEALEKFRNNNSLLLCTVESLDEGLDVVDVSVALITSGTRNSLQHDQRKGRVYRYNPDNPEEKVIIVNFYIEGTRDEDALKDRQSSLSSYPIEVRSIDELKQDLDELQQR